MYRKKTEKGFTLIEMLVAITLFSFVVTIALGALFTILKANEKAKLMKLVVNNLNMAMEGMTREIRVGKDLEVVGSDEDHLRFTTERGCKMHYKKSYLSGREAIVRYIEDADSLNPKIELAHPGICRGKDDHVFLTGSNVTIEKMIFRTTGVGAGDGFQPRVLITIKGVIEKSGIEEVFDIQTTISQRKTES